MARPALRMPGEKKERASGQRVDDEDGRLVPGASATRSNVGPQRAGAPEAEELDAPEGTTSGTGLRGKPHRGSKLDGDV